MEYNRWMMPLSRFLPFTLLMFALLCFASTGFSESDIRSERISYAKGANSTTIEASIKGYEIVDYVVSARAGQTMNTSLGTKHGATYFNILAPGENDVAMFIGSVKGKQFEGVLPASGDYRLRVYMMRSAARRGEKAEYRLEVVVD